MLSMKHIRVYDNHRNLTWWLNLEDEAIMLDLSIIIIFIILYQCQSLRVWGCSVFMDVSCDLHTNMVALLMHTFRQSANVCLDIWNYDFNFCFCKISWILQIYIVTTTSWTITPKVSPLYNPWNFELIKLWNPMSWGQVCCNTTRGLKAELPCERRHIWNEWDFIFIIWHT